MTSPLSRIGEAFLAPADTAARVDDRVHEAVAPAAIAVLARAQDAVAAGGAVALGLARGTAVVLLWGVEAPAVRAPATPSARKSAARLAERGHEAVGTGRLVLVTLRGGIDEAVRASAAAALPAVVVVAGPRDERVDAVLTGQDRAIAVGDGAIADLAAQSGAALGGPAGTLALPSAPAARALAASGVALVAPLRAPVEEAVR